MIKKEIDLEDDEISLLTDPNNSTDLPEFSTKYKDLTESSDFTVIADTKEIQRVIKKSSVVWFLSNRNKN